MRRRRRSLVGLLPPGFRPRGAIERRAARRRRLRAERRTWALGVAAMLTTGAVAGAEVARVARLRGEPRTSEAVRETVELAVAGYRGGSTGENALLNLLASFTVTWGAARGSAHAIRSRGRWGPFRNLEVGEQHIHHFVPGIVLALLAGGASIGSRREELNPLLAVPFGVGSALILDESALLLKLDDVYWTEEGIVSVQITLAALLMFSALVLALRVLRRGEREMLPDLSPQATVRSPA